MDCGCWHSESFGVDDHLCAKHQAEEDERIALARKRRQEYEAENPHVVKCTVNMRPWLAGHAKHFNGNLRDPYDYKQEAEARFGNKNDAEAFMRSLPGIIQTEYRCELTKIVDGRYMIRG